MDGFAVPTAPPKRQRHDDDMDVDAMDIDSEGIADMQIDFDELDFDEAELDELLEQTPVVDELDVKSLRKVEYPACELPLSCLCCLASDSQL